MTATISLYKNAFDKTGTSTLGVDDFLEAIRNGGPRNEWQDIVIPLRALQGSARDEAKKRMPCVTIAGLFGGDRRDADLITPSGFLGVDIDDLPDPEKFKETLKSDPYVYAAFVSAGGKGLCVIHKINPKRHREAFRGLSEYYYNKYKIVIDPTSINPSRLRFVSYDPHIYIATTVVDTFAQYPKEKEPKKVERVAFVPSDFEHIMEQIQQGRINLGENYHEWVRIGFALAHQFGASGEEFFHVISSMSAKYEPDLCARQYKNCLRSTHTGQEVTISTFYYYCKLANIVTYSQRTRKIVTAAMNGKKTGITAEAVVENLRQFEDIDGEDVLGIVRQVQENNIHIEDTSVIDQIEMYLRQGYDLRKNEITRNIENRGTPLKQADLNSIYICTKKIIDSVSFDLVDRLIHSNFTPSYNPIQDFFRRHESMNPTGHIEKFFSAINTTDQDYLQHFGKRWLVGAISSAFGEHSTLMLVLSGSTQNTGKTEFFRRMLPGELRPYYAESKLDAGKDDDILMCQKWFVMDDEMGGKSKKESKRLKELTSKQMFSLREPYGRNNVDMMRLAVLCGTTNDNEILNDPTGNRRIIPVRVNSIDHELYNSVDKTSLLMEAYHVWKSGFQWRLSKEDIEFLNKDAASFQETCMEAELIAKYYRHASVGNFSSTHELTASEIKTELEYETKQKLSLHRLGAEMKHLGYEQVIRRNGPSTKRIYVVERAPGFHGMYAPTSPYGITSNHNEPENLPF